MGLCLCFLDWSVFLLFRLLFVLALIYYDHMSLFPVYRVPLCYLLLSLFEVSGYIRVVLVIIVTYIYGPSHYKQSRTRGMPSTQTHTSFHKCFFQIFFFSFFPFFFLSESLWAKCLGYLLRLLVLLFEFKYCHFYSFKENNKYFVLFFCELFLSLWGYFGKLFLNIFLSRIVFIIVLDNIL